MKRNIIEQHTEQCPRRHKTLQKLVITYCKFNIKLNKTSMINH